MKLLPEMFVSEHVGVWRRTHDPQGIRTRCGVHLVGHSSVSNQCDPEHQEVAWGILAMQLLDLTLQQMRVWGMVERLGRW